MSDCGGDCGGGDDCGGDYGGGDVEIETFDSDYPAKASDSVSDPPDESTHVTYFESSAPADEPTYAYGNNEVSETFEEKRVQDESYSFYNDSNNWDRNRNDYLPGRTYRSNSFSNNLSDDCNNWTCFKVILIASGCLSIVVLFIFILKI